jgi:hypothetical protein
VFLFTLKVNNDLFLTIYQTPSHQYVIKLFLHSTIHKEEEVKLYTVPLTLSDNDIDSHSELAENFFPSFVQDCQIFGFLHAA